MWKRKRGRSLFSISPTIQYKYNEKIEPHDGIKKICFTTPDQLMDQNQKRASSTTEY
jgi:hypothetical protein